MRIPSKVLEKLDASIQDKIRFGETPSSGNIDYLEKLESMDKDIKGRTRDILWHIYNNEGYMKFLDIVAHLKQVKNHHFNDIIQMKGETAEVVLEILIHQFIKERELKNWHMFKGLILGDENNKNFSTELDIVLVCPEVVSIVEIKSYNGDKVLTGDCYLTSNNAGHVLEKDVFSQNKLHIKAFWDNFKKHSIGTTGVIKSVLFSYSRGTLVDNRLPEKKVIMPAYDEIAMPGYLDAVSNLKRSPRWEVDSLVDAIKYTEKNSIGIDKHISYVNSIHGNK